jgi:hypothetical protein
VEWAGSFFVDYSPFRLRQGFGGQARINTVYLTLITLID